MNTLNITFISLLTLASCTTAGVKFSDMTPAEIMAYNRTVKYLDQLYCSELVSIGSHIRRYECVTHRDLAEGRVGSLDTPSSSYSVTRQTWEQ
jgi:hypothetical protein